MKSWNRRAPKGTPLPAGSVYLVCERSGRWIGDVLEARPGWTWWRGHPRYHVGIVDDACRHHNHIPPTDSQVAAKMAEAKQHNASIPLRLKATEYVYTSTE